MSERHRILAAAAELDSFSPSALAARADANLNTVRAVLQRDTPLFEVIGHQRGAGRPARRLRVADHQALEAELDRARLPTPVLRSAQPAQDQAQDGGDGALPALDVPLTGPPSTARPDAALLEAASTALRRAVESDDQDDRHIYARSAADTAAVLLRDAGEDGDGSVHLADGQHRLAALIGLAAELLELGDSAPQSPGVRERLQRLASALLPVMRFAPEEAPRLLRCVLMLSRRLGFAPPIAVVAPRRPDRRSTLLGGLSASDWSEHPLAELDSTLWWPSWTQPLAARHALAGMVVVADRVSDVGDYLEGLENWSVPKLVTCSLSDPEADDQIGRAGAIKLQGLRSLDDAVETIGKALDQRGVAAPDLSTVEGVGGGERRDALRRSCEWVVRGGLGALKATS